MNEEEEYGENLLLCARPFIELLLEGGYLRVPAENVLIALICSGGAVVIMREVKNFKGSEPADCCATD